MCGISVEYNKIATELGTIKLELASIQGLEVRNNRVLNDIKSTVGDLLETLENYEKKIKNVQEEILNCQDRTNSQIQGLENESFGNDPLQIVLRTVAGGTAIGALAIGAAEELVASETVASGIGVIGGPITIICIAGFYTAISQLYMHSRKNKKRKSLIDALKKVLTLLEALLIEADKFNESHGKTIKDLENYLLSVDKTINLFNYEGPLNISGLTSFMLEKTGDIQSSFESIKRRAENNAESLRESLLNINPRSIINS